MGIMDYLVKKGKEIGEWKEEMEEYQIAVQDMTDNELKIEYRRWVHSAGGTAGVKRSAVAKELTNRGFILSKIL